MSDWENINKYIFQLINNYLIGADILNTSLVCKRWHTLSATKLADISDEYSYLLSVRVMIGKEKKSNLFTTKKINLEHFPQFKQVVCIGLNQNTKFHHVVDLVIHSSEYIVIDLTACEYLECVSIQYGRGIKILCKKNSNFYISGDAGFSVDWL